MTRTWTRIGALIAVATLAACGGDRAENTNSAEAGSGARMEVSSGTNDSTALADADVKITSTDSKITLAVLRDSVVMQLSDSLRQSVQLSVDSSMQNEVDGGGMGGSIARMVGGAVSKAVNGAMGIALRAPTSQVTDLRYENGRLYFKVEGGNMKFSTHGTGSNDGALFAEDDAKRFIDAVERSKSKKISM